MVSELESKIRDFDLSVNVQHWSGCWGGTVPKTLVSNIPDYLNELNSDWLQSFLSKSDLTRIAVETVSGSPNGKNKEISGSEYIIKVRFNPNYNLDSNRNDHTAVIVTCADGKPAHSRLKHDSSEVGVGLFKGYRLEPGKVKYTITYSLVEESNGFYDSPRFKQDCKTIIGSHLYFIETRLMKKDIDLSNLTPSRTSIIVHEPNSFR